MTRHIIPVFVVAWALGMALIILVGFFSATPAPAKTETLSCVRIKEVTPAGTINYLCEVKNAKPQ